jgi:hypothetical protein
MIPSDPYINGTLSALRLPCTIRNFHILTLPFQINAFNHASRALKHTPYSSPLSPIQCDTYLTLLATAQPTGPSDTNLRTSQLKKKKVNIERSYIFEPYISILPQFQCRLHQIFTSRAFYVSQVFISHIAVSGCRYKALFCIPIIQWKRSYCNTGTNFLAGK